MSIPGQRTLEEHDPVMANLIELEKARQFHSLELIASKNLSK